MEHKRQGPIGSSGSSSRERERRRTSGDRRAPSEEKTRRPRPAEKVRNTSEKRRTGPRPQEGTTAPTEERGIGSRGRRRPEEERKGPSERRQRPAPAAGNGDAPKKPEKRVRSEQALKAAEQRKAIRAEKARLFRLRKKQKRQAKRRTVKHISKGLFKRLAIMAGIIVAVILSMVIFFRVGTIEVEGNAYYSQEEILQNCGVAVGDNLLTLSRGKISGNIMAPLKYVDSVKVTRQLPDTLIIRVTEGKPKYAVQDTEGNYYLITAAGKVMEQIEDRQAGEFTRIREMTIVPPAIGDEIQVYAAPGSESKAKGQFSAMKTLLKEIEEANLGRHIVSVDISSSFKISLWYEDRFQVELGDTNRMAYKLEYLKVVIDKEESYVTGTIDLTLKSGDKAILLRGEEN